MTSTHPRHVLPAVLLASTLLLTTGSSATGERVAPGPRPAEPAPRRAATALAEVGHFRRVDAARIADARRMLAGLPRTARAAGAIEGPVPRPVRPAAGGAGVEVPSGAGAAAVAVRFALDQLGKPYVWGATGPGSYDCSGLVLAAYRTAGVALPRTSSAQSTAGAVVSRDAVQAGDLIFYYEPVSHVAIALDAHRAVHASTPGVPVAVASIDAIGPVTGIRRVVR
jgi:peptidoglycan DL-endopeptidase CwlO